MRMPVLIRFFILALLASSVHAQAWDWSRFIADTLVIQLPVDSNHVDTASLIQVMDNRETPGPVLGIRQVKKWRYIPVDQYFVLKEPLAEALTRYLPERPMPPETTLVIDNITIWYDGSPMFFAGWTLNGYTQLVDVEGTAIRDWQWEFRLKKKRKRKTEESIGILMGWWMKAQGDTLSSPLPEYPVSPRRYRRQMIVQLDQVILPDGYLVDARLSLKFPPDQMYTYIRGAPGMGIYYRKSSRHESIAFGGRHVQSYRRWHSDWLGRLDAAYRIGGNNFNPNKFDSVDWWNIFMLQFSLTFTVEYHPRYLKGLFAGAGAFQAINVLPTVIPRYETGLLLTLGVVLP